MSLIKVYDGIFQSLAEDSDILDLLGLGEGATLVDKALHIQKRAKPQSLADNIPLITFYTPGGARESENDSVFESVFVFDIYTSDDVEQAQLLADCIINLFSNDIPNFLGVTNFQSSFEDGHESDAGLANVYCFTIVMSFSFGIV